MLCRNAKITNFACWTFLTAKNNDSDFDVVIDLVWFGTFSTPRRFWIFEVMVLIKLHALRLNCRDSNFRISVFLQINFEINLILIASHRIDIINRDVGEFLRVGQVFVWKKTPIVQFQIKLQQFPFTRVFLEIKSRN